MQVIKPLKHIRDLPEKDQWNEKYRRHPYSIFFGGSIEMGKAENWQDRLANDLEDLEGIIFNPRRDNWDPSWVHDPTLGSQFHDQVSWELDHLGLADLRVFYFDPETMSPVTLLELGTYSRWDCIVCCPDGYWRQGNVQVFCNRFGIPFVKTYSEMLELIKKHYKTKLQGE